MSTHPHNDAADQRFRRVFTHIGAIAAYARRRGSPDPDAVAAEVMAIAWRRLADVPADDPRPWLFATARNLLMADARRHPRTLPGSPESAAQRAPDSHGIDPRLAAALRAVSPLDREALLLIAWEDLTPTQAAHALGVNPTAFRVRLLRARRRFQAALAAADPPAPSRFARPQMERTR